jgi:hypothetical protein
MPRVTNQRVRQKPIQRQTRQEKPNQAKHEISPAPINYCSPKQLANFREHQTCYAPDVLTQLAQAFNKEHRDQLTIDLHLDPKRLWVELKNRMKQYNCTSETCWTTSPIARKYGLSERMRSSLRPDKPNEWYSDNNTWLSNYDIDDVMRQYDEAYPDFSFVGVYGRDFADYAPKIANINIADLLQRGVTRFGAVFNTDRRNEPGSHWVALYVGLDPTQPNFGFYYYDSNGMKPFVEIVEYVNKLERDLKRLGIGGPQRCNRGFCDVRHQYGNSECGMFSMFFLVRMINGWPFSNIVHGDFKDLKVNMLRDLLFRPRNV